MKILDLRAWQEVVYGERAGVSEASRNSAVQWAVFLMGGQEPNTISAIEQIFAQDDLSYLYKECLGIVPNVFAQATNVADSAIVMKGSARVYPKGLSYRDAVSSFCLPDSITGKYAKIDVSMLGAAGTQTSGSPDKPTTFVYETPQNFIGLYAMQNLSTAPTVSIDGTSAPVTYDAATQMWNFNQCITGRAIEIRTVRERGFIPVSCDPSKEDSWGSVTWAVLAPMNLLSHANLIGFNIPWISGTVGTEPTQNETPYYLSDSKRNGSLTLFMDSFYIGRSQ